MSKPKIAVIEDEDDLREILEYNLQREGFETFSSADGGEGLSMVRERRPDLVLLDLMLPGRDGLEVCREIKTDERLRSTHIIMLTAKSEETDVVLGLGLGADDYMTKPFRPSVLIARVKAVLRRGPLKVEESSAKERVEVGALSIDAGRHEVRVGGEPVELTATEFRLLHFLASHPGRVFSREQIINHAIGQTAVVIDRNIDVHVRAVRKKIGELRELIQTVRGVGYRFKDDG